MQVFAADCATRRPGGGNAPQGAAQRKVAPPPSPMTGAVWRQIRSPAVASGPGGGQQALRSDSACPKGAPELCPKRVQNRLGEAAGAWASSRPGVRHHVDLGGSEPPLGQVRPEASPAGLTGKLFIARTRNAANATRVDRLLINRMIKLGQQLVSRAADPVRRPKRRPVFMRFCTIWRHDTGNHRNFRRCCSVKGPIGAGGSDKVASGHRQPFVRYCNGAGCHRQG